ncbi:MAG: VCBS repeat-containing protein, partial [Candidatus Melainabacteria bacterium]|nr:VCBS repeat-containing protein [Candidatus Melainabacteria bacterium]
MNKINKKQLLKSFISILAIFAFNLPTLAALNINYGNLFVIPQSNESQKVKQPTPADLLAQSETTTLEDTDDQTKDLETTEIIEDVEIQENTKSIDLEETSLESTPINEIQEDVKSFEEYSFGTSTIKLNKHECLHARGVSTTLSFDSSTFNIPKIKASDSSLFTQDSTIKLLVTGELSGRGLGIIFQSQKAEEITFENPALIKGGVILSNPITVDINGDELQDIVAIDKSENKLYVFIATGNEYLEPIVLNTGLNPNSLALRDYNNDGLYDIAVTNASSNSISVFLGTNNEDLFKEPHTILVNSAPSYVIASDFNSDNNIDLAVSLKDENKISIFTGDGKGRFTEQTENAINIPHPIKLITADLNNDDIPDLIAATSNKTIYIVLGNGNGTFNSSKSFNVAGEVSDISLGHFNEDCNLDLVTSNQDNNISILRGKGNGDFEPSVEFAIEGIPIKVTTADINTDGYDDIIVTTKENTLNILTKSFTKETTITTETVVEEEATTTEDISEIKTKSHDVTISTDDGCTATISVSGESTSEGGTQSVQHVPNQIIVSYADEAEANLQSRTFRARANLTPNIDFLKLEPIHPTEQIVKEFKSRMKKGFESGKEFHSLSRKYTKVEEVSNEEVFKEAYTKMREEEQQSFRSYVATLPEDISVEEAIEILKNDPRIENVEPNAIFKLSFTPNDPFYASQN